MVMPWVVTVGSKRMLICKSLTPSGLDSCFKSCCTFCCWSALRVSVELTLTRISSFSIKLSSGTSREASDLPPEEMSTVFGRNPPWSGNEVNASTRMSTSTGTEPFCICPT